MEWGVLATDSFFRKADPAVPSQKKVLEKGYKLIHQSATAPYACNNLEYKPELQVLDYAAVHYSTNPVFSGVTLPEPPFPGQDEAVRGVLKAEKAFSGEKIRSQRALERLGAAYYTAWKAFSAAGDIPVSAELLARWRLIALKTVNFGLVLNGLSYHMASYHKTMLNAELGAGLLTRTASIFMTRNYYSLVFMPFSPSVWLLPEKPAYLLAGVRVSYGGGVMDYNEAVEKYGAAEVHKALDNALEIHSLGHMGGPPVFPAR
jgi:hypothetical protein